MQDEAEPGTSIDLTRQVASLRALARSLVRDPSGADDLVQDTLVVALERPPRSRDSVRGWLATVARRLALDRSRGERRRVAREEQVARPEGEGPPQDRIERLEVEREVLDAVQSLREPYRTAIFLRYWEGLDPAAIAAKLDVPVKTVRSRITRALEELRAKLDERFEGGRSRWMSALLPIAFPPAPAPTGSGLGPAGIAGGAWIVKKALVAAAVVLLVVLGWRALSAEGSAGGAPLVSSGGIKSPVEPAPATADAPTVVEEARESTARIAAASTAADAPAEPRGDIQVTLFHEDGTPAVDYSIDVRCKLDPAPREEYLRRRTDAEGRVEMPGLHAGDAVVYVDRGARYDIEVVAGERREVELHLDGGMTVVGRVVGPDGAPVAGAEIWIEGRRLLNSREHRSARTAPDGSFRVAELLEDAEIGARASGYTASPVYEVASLPIGEGGVRTIELALGADGLEIGGRVVDPAGKPVADALVKIGERGGGIVDLPSGLRAAQPGPVPVSTDEDGRFVYAGGLPEGVHDVAVAARGWPIWKSSVEVRAGMRNHVEVVLAEPSSVEGRVVDASGAPVERARVVSAREHQGGWYFEPFPSSADETDAEGRFRLDWVAPGQQELNADVSSRPELGKAKLHAECVAGRKKVVELVLDPGLTITGRVVDREGRPLAKWQVHANPNPYGFAYPRQGKTDGDGRFLVANLDRETRYDLGVNPAGTFSIPSRGERRGVEPGARDVEIVVADLREPSSGVRGRLEDADGRVPGDLRITYYPEGGDTGGYIDFDPKTGAFEQGKLLPGRYELRLYRGGQTVHRTEVFELLAGETKDVGVLVPGTLGRLELVLRGVPEADLEHAMPMLDREGHGTEHFTIEKGVLHSRSITPGTWTISLVHGGWFLRGNEVVVSAGVTTRRELTPERAYETVVECTFADPAAPWTKLSSKVFDAEGVQVQVGNTWFRGMLQDGKVRLHGLSLPAGRFKVVAWTDSGLEGGIDVEIGPASVGVEHEIAMR